MLPRGSRLPFLLIAAAVAGLSACGSDNDVGFRPLAPGDTYALTSGNRLISFNRSSPGTRRSNALITGIAAGESLIGVDFRPANGLLYGVDTAGAIYTIDTVSGVATQVLDGGDPVVIEGATLDGDTFGVDFNPVPDRLRIVSDSGQNLRVNVDTGATIVDGALTLNAVSASGIAAAAYTNSFSATCRTALFYLDASNNTLLSTSAPNDGVLSSVGPLGVTGAISAFEISTSSTGANSAFATIAANGASTLYSVNTTTGAATARGLIAAPAGETVLGLAMAPPATAPAQAAGELYGVTDANALVTFNRAAPNKFCTNVAIAGLNTGEDVVGLDYRPSTGTLHALGNASGTARLLTLDPVTGAATGVPISVPLTGEAFGMDFNPTGPVALRIVSDTGQNLRVNDGALASPTASLTGATTADGQLNPMGASGSAAAYTNSVAGTGTTTLYVVDATADTLNIQNPPNAGTLVGVGDLGLDFTSMSGFDIDGRDNVALLAGSVDGATTSTLYTVNLGTGAATVVAGGAIGSGSGFTGQLRGLTRPTPTTTVFGLRDGTELVELSLSDPATVTPIGAITGLTTDTALVGIDVRTLDGLLYGVGNMGGLYTIDSQTASATRVALAADATDLSDPFTGLNGAGFGVDFNPAPATVPLRIVSDASQNLRVANIATGATFTDAALTRATTDTFSISAVAYTNSVTPVPMSTALFGLDAAGDQLVQIVSPNDGTVRVIGPTGVAVTTDAVMDIVGPPTSTSAGVAIAILNTALTDKPVYSINLGTGAATLIGTTSGPVEAIVGLAAPISNGEPAVDSAVFAVDAGKNLISFARNAPQTRIVDAGITGLTGTVVGIDFRTTGGLLWLLTRDAGLGRLYTIDTSAVTGATTTVAATLVSTLAASVADASEPYMGLDDAAFGMDFNPTGPVALRIVGTTGQNLRVGDPTTGATFTDGAIAPAAPSVSAAAYSNSFRAPTGTTPGTALFVVDPASGRLLTQGANPAVAGDNTCPASMGNPNCGVLMPVGALAAGGTVSTVSGFDIAGGANGIVLAALQLGGDTSSRLYRINLATGAATEVSSGVFIGGAGAPLLDGLAIRIQ